MPVLTGSFSQLPMLMYFGAYSGPQRVRRLHEDTSIMITKEYNSEFPPECSWGVSGLDEAFSLFIGKRLYTIFYKLYTNVSSGCNKPLSAVSHC